MLADRLSYFKIFLFQYLFNLDLHITNPVLIGEIEDALSVHSFVQPTSSIFFKNKSYIIHSLRNANLFAYENWASGKTKVYNNDKMKRYNFFIFLFHL